MDGLKTNFETEGGGVPKERKALNTNSKTNLNKRSLVQPGVSWITPLFIEIQTEFSSIGMGVVSF